MFVAPLEQRLHCLDAGRARGPGRPTDVQRGEQAATQAGPQHLGIVRLEEGAAFVATILEYATTIVQHIARTEFLHSVHASLRLARA